MGSRIRGNKNTKTIGKRRREEKEVKQKTEKNRRRKRKERFVRSLRYYHSSQDPWAKAGEGRRRVETRGTGRLWGEGKRMGGGGMSLRMGQEMGRAGKWTGEVLG